MLREPQVRRDPPGRLQLARLPLPVVDGERHHLEAGGRAQAAAVAESRPPESSTAARLHAATPASSRALAARALDLVPRRPRAAAPGRRRPAQSRPPASAAEQDSVARCPRLHVLHDLATRRQGVAHQHLVAPGPQRRRRPRSQAAEAPERAHLEVVRDDRPDRTPVQSAHDAAGQGGRAACLPQGRRHARGRP